MSKILPFNSNNNNSKDKDNDNSINQQQCCTTSMKKSSKLKFRNKNIRSSKKGNHNQNQKIYRPCRSSTLVSKDDDVRNSFKKFKNNKQSTTKQFRHKNKNESKNNDNDNNENIIKKRTKNVPQIRRHMSTSSSLLRSRSMFVKLRQKSRNFGIRCKTSVELWRKWIKRGINWHKSSDHYYYNNNDNDKNESIKPSTSTSTKQMINEKMPSSLTTSKNDSKKMRKNIITDVIPEEDEQQDDKINDKIYENECKKQQQQQQQQQQQSNALNDLKPIINVDNDNQQQQQQQQQEQLNDKKFDSIKINRIKNALKKSAIINDNVDRSPQDDLDKIETITNDDDQDQKDLNHQIHQMNEKTKSSHRNSIRKAFMKLRLFF